MDLLGTSIFNQMRGYLSFQEIHAKRVINSRWNNIEEVPKAFRLIQNPPGRACFKNIIKLVLLIGNRLTITTIDRVLSESRHTLKILVIAEWPEMMDFIPLLPNVKSLGINAHRMAGSFLQKCPNLKSIWVQASPRYPLEVDLRNHEEMQHIFIKGSFSQNIEDQISLKNLSTHTQALEISIATRNVTNEYVSRILSLNANINVHFFNPPKEKEPIFSVTANKICVAFDKNPDKLKGWLIAVKKIRDLLVVISKDLDVKATFRVATALADTKLFTRDEI